MMVTQVIQTLNNVLLYLEQPQTLILLFNDHLIFITISQLTH